MAPINSATSASFVFASLQEFVNLWRSGNEASFKVDCKDGKASLSFSCNLGNPDHHIQHGRSRKKKSVTRVLRNNARAAAFQAARTVSSPAPQPQPPPHRTVTSPSPSPPALVRDVTSLTVTPSVGYPPLASLALTTGRLPHGGKCLGALGTQRYYSCTVRSPSQPRDPPGN